jgi:pimeloyl-ACP methyl ester carboxylesterase
MTKSKTSGPADYHHHFIPVEGVRLHYVTSGGADKEPVVLLAGYPESWSAWRKLMPLLSDRYRMIAIDLPGQGDSDKPTDGYDTVTVARRVHGLLEQIGIRRYGLIAHDIGSWVAFPYALMFQEEISGLVLMDAAIPGITLPDMLPASPDRSWKTWHFPFHAIADLHEALIQGRERVYLDWFLRQKAANPFSFSDEEVDEYVRIMTLPGALRAGLAFYRAVPQSAEQNKRLARDVKLSIPVLALTADHGSLPDMAEPLRPYATTITGETIANCGHFLPEEQPEAVAQAVLRFFSRG